MAYMRNLQAFFLNQKTLGGSPKYADIAYSFMVMPSGRIYMGRGWRVRDAATGTSTGSRHGVSLSICFAGNFEVRTPTTAALDAARWLIYTGQKRDFITKKLDIFGHRDWKATACPGANLYVQLSYIRKPWPKPRRYRVRRPGGGLTKRLGFKVAMRRLRRLARKLRRGKEAGVKRVQ